MTDYRTLSTFHKKRVDKMIMETVEPGRHINEHNGFEWTEPDDTLKQVHSGYYCADCLMSYYTCLCSHNI